jgi:hypothetical protein
MRSFAENGEVRIYIFPNLGSIPQIIDKTICPASKNGLMYSAFINISPAYVIIKDYLFLIIPHNFIMGKNLDERIISFVTTFMYQDMTKCLTSCP